MVQTILVPNDPSLTASNIFFLSRPKAADIVMLVSTFENFGAELPYTDMNTQL